MSIFEARKVMLQTILTLLVLTACIVYAIARIRKAVHAPSDPCAGCTGCRLREELREKADCPHKTAHCLQSGACRKKGWPMKSSALRKGAAQKKASKNLAVRNKSSIFAPQN